MKLLDLNPFIRYARMHYPPFYTKNKDSICYDARLFYIREGSGLIFVNGAEYPISDQTAIYLPPLSRYRFRLSYSEHTRVYTFDFDLSAERSALDSSLGTATEESFDPSLAPSIDPPSELSAPLVLEMPEIETHVRSCLEGFTDRLPLYREYASLYMKSVLLSLVPKKERNAISPLCRCLISYVRENACDPFLTNERIADALHYSSHHLNRMIRESLGLSLHAYILICRLEIAKNLLESTALSVCEIAYRSGFCTAAHFAKCFKEAEGITPLAYRRAHRHAEI